MYKSNIKQAKKYIVDGSKKSLHAIGVFVVSEVVKSIDKQRIVDTGRLKGSYMFEEHEDFVRIGTNVDYSIYQEFGTEKIVARPHLRPSIEGNIPTIQKIARSVW
jgi:hypothetical protein